LIGESAVVTAPILATSIIVAGNAKGDIIGTQRIELVPLPRCSTAQARMDLAKWYPDRFGRFLATIAARDVLWVHP
jgi:hypothetical protein